MRASEILTLLSLNVIKLKSKECDPDGYYIFNENKHLINIMESFKPFKTDSSLVIDQHFESVVRSLMIDYTTDEESDVTPHLFGLGNSSKNVAVESCPIQHTFTNNIVYYCARPTRFLQVAMERSVTIHKINSLLTFTYSEFYAGCYKASNSTSFVTRGMVDCLAECRGVTGKYEYAGIKSGRCHCFQHMYGMDIVEDKHCSNRCTHNKGMLCGNSSHIPIYFISSVKCQILGVECIYNNSKCGKCSPGYKGISCLSRDCSSNNGDCGAGTCEFLPEFLSGISICKCWEGFKPRLFGNCSDIDECDISTNKCRSQKSRCLNSVGSYKCICSEGLLQVDDLTCNDIDECKLPKPCVSIKNCTNLWGSYTCECPPGYETYNLTSECIDIDECEMQCPDGICTNTEGSYTCRCKAGFSLATSGRCEDVNECVSVNLCDVESTKCVNSKGTYECVCLRGYEKTTTYKCIDIDECLFGIHKCDKSASCQNSIGSFNCFCGSGYIREVFSYITVCQDIDECKNKSACDRTNSLCVNQDGSYSCQCRIGYININRFACKQTSENFTTVYYDDFFTVEHKEMDLRNLVAVAAITMGSVFFLLVLSMAIYIKCRYFSDNLHGHVHNDEMSDADRISTSSN